MEAFMGKLKPDLDLELVKLLQEAAVLARPEKKDLLGKPEDSEVYQNLQAIRRGPGKNSPEMREARVHLLFTRFDKLTRSLNPLVPIFSEVTEGDDAFEEAVISYGLGDLENTRL